jgi:hypothetical protein
MKRTFFDYISSASEEKIHSQTIGWLLSKNCDALQEGEKKKFLQLLLGEKKFKRKFNIKDVLVEYFDIDLLIVCDNFVVVIENKLKSSEHSNQLEKYVLLVENKIDPHRANTYLRSLPGIFKENENTFNSTRKKIQDSLGGKNEDSYFVYLNFIGKNASSNKYVNITYNQILTYLRGIYTIGGSRIDAPILESYKTSLENLEICIAEFLNNPYMRRWVAEKSMFNKKDMLLHGTIFPDELNSEIMTYVIENNLINTLQLYFLNLVVNKLSAKTKPDEFEINASLSGSNRQGNIHIRFKKLEFTFGEVICHFGYQIQIGPNKPRGSEKSVSNGTDKIAITTNLINHKVLQIIDKRYFRKLFNNDAEFEDWTPHGIKKKGSKGNYISITKPFASGTYFTDFNVEEAVKYVENNVLNKKSFIYSKIKDTFDSMKRTSQKKV